MELNSDDDLFLSTRTLNNYVSDKFETYFISYEFAFFLGRCSDVWTCRRNVRIETVRRKYRCLNWTRKIRRQRVKQMCAPEELNVLATCAGLPRSRRPTKKNQKRYVATNLKIEEVLLFPPPNSNAGKYSYAICCGVEVRRQFVPTTECGTS